MCGVTGKKNLAVRYNELGDRHTYALNKYHFGTLFVRQLGSREGIWEGRDNIRVVHNLVKEDEMNRKGKAPRIQVQLNAVF